MSKARQRGFSLAELMVSLVIGLFVLAGVGSVYITGKRSYQARDGLSLLQENGRAAISVIERTVMRAGYPMFADLQPVVHSEGQLIALKLKNPKLQELIGETGEVLVTDSRTHRVNLENDTYSDDVLTVQYIPQGEGVWSEGFDCLGNPTKIRDRVISRFIIEGGSLKCKGSTGSTAQPLVDNVAAMQVEYGVDLDDDGFADQYANTNYLNIEKKKGNDMWGKVVAIRVALLVHSGEDVLDEPVNGDQEFVLAGETITVESKNDKKLYRVFQTTIPLRNRMEIL